MQETDAAVSDDVREKYDRDGYVILDDVGVPESVLNGIVDDLKDQFTPDVRMVDKVLQTPTRAQDAWHISENVRALARSPKVLALLEDLYGRRPLPFQTLNFQVGTQQATRSDALHFNSKPPGYMCGVWVALEDIDMDNGPLIYFPGSHNLPFLDYNDVPFEADEENFPD